MTPRARQATVALGMLAIVLLFWKSVVNPLPRLVWNASPSVAIGLYAVHKQRPGRGEIAVLKPPSWAAFVAQERQYLPHTAWLLKPVAATRGDIVCRFSAYVFINGKLVAFALRRDNSGS